MKKLNKKGFTLVELLVVIVILVVIMSIAIPSITSSLERSKQKEYDAKVKLIISAAELYFDKHRNSYPISSNTSTSYQVDISELITEGYLTEEEAKDPFTNNIIDDSGKTDTSICIVEVNGVVGAYTYGEVYDQSCW